MHDLLKTRGRYVDTNGEFVVALFMAEPQTNIQVIAFVSTYYSTYQLNGSIFYTFITAVPG